MKAPISKQYTVTVTIPIVVHAVNAEHAALEARLRLECLDGWARDGYANRPNFETLDYDVSPGSAAT